MNLLILTADYPRIDGTHSMMFVHVRNLYYKEQGLDITVLNFSCDYDYDIDGIHVITLQTYMEKNIECDIAVSHASNLRNHYRFLRKYEDRFKHIVFFFHGHEVLRLSEDYPKPYSYVQKNIIRNRVTQDIYDNIKMFIWRKYYQKIARKAEFVFVSNWILERFESNIGLGKKELSGHVHIINNSIGTPFEKESYDITCQKNYDFICIRGNLDGSKYCVDLVMKLAENNSDLKFLLIGRGKYFRYNKKPDNVEWIDKTMNHLEMIPYLNQSKCGILLTREDTQGVMTCELAAFGIPVITSDIDVCKEFFYAMPNVRMISNSLKCDIHKILQELAANLPYTKDDTYFSDNTISKEVDLYRKLL